MVDSNQHSVKLCLSFILTTSLAPTKPWEQRMHKSFSQNLGYCETMTQHPRIFPGFKNAFEFIKIPKHLSHAQYDNAAELLHDI